MKRWEYRLISSADVRTRGVLQRRSRELLEDYLNQLGAEGWEIVSADFWEDFGDEKNFAALARRELPDPDSPGGAGAAAPR